MDHLVRTRSVHVTIPRYHASYTRFIYPQLSCFMYPHLLLAMNDTLVTRPTHERYAAVPVELHALKLAAFH